MKYYLLLLSILIASSVGAQEEPQLDGAVQRVPTVPTREMRLTDQNPPYRSGMTPETRAYYEQEGDMEDRTFTKPIGEFKPVDRNVEDRVRTLTDVESGAADILKERFNIIEQRRLENAGETRERLVQRRESLENKFRERRTLWEGSRKEVSEEKKEKVTGLARGILEKMENAISRLENADAKIQERITEDSSEELIGALENANILLEEAKTSMDLIKEEIDSELENEEGLSKEALKGLMNQAKEDIRTAWDAYKEVINLIKE